MKTILLDPGHPSHAGDSGCLAPGIVESNYTYKFCQYLELMIKLSLTPFVIVLTRNDITEVVDLKTRGERAKEANADLSLCVHVNSHETELLHGAMAFALTIDDPIIRDLGDIWLRAQPEPLYTYGRKTYLINPKHFQHAFEQRVFNVLEKLPKPALLLELGFASNPVDRSVLLDAPTQFGMVSACMVLLARFQQLRDETTYHLFGGHF